MNRLIFRIGGAVVCVVLASLAMSLDQSLRLGISLVVGLPSLVCLLISRKQLGDSLSIMPKAKALVTRGFYSKIQHPMYFFLDLLLLCLIIWIHVPVLFVVWAILVVLQVLQARREELLLQKAFGVEYERYASCTWF